MSTIRLSIGEVAGDFPDFEVAVVLATDLHISESLPPSLEALIVARETACREAYAGAPLSEIPEIAVWREAYKAFGVRKTSYRSSVERLVKNVQAGRVLPRINSFVDSYNAVSLAHLMPVGADDADCIAPEMAFRYAREGDTFHPLGKPEAGNDPPKPGEVVLAAGDKVLCRRWNWYQDARSAIALGSCRAVVTVQANGLGNLEAAVLDLVSLMETHCAATCRTGFASARSPVVSLSG